MTAVGRFPCWKELASCAARRLGEFAGRKDRLLLSVTPNSAGSVRVATTVTRTQTSTIRNRNRTANRPSQRKSEERGAPLIVPAVNGSSGFAAFGIMPSLSLHPQGWGGEGDGAIGRYKSLCY